MQISQEDLDRFLKIAHRLKIEGLVTEPIDNQEAEVNSFKSEPAEVKIEEATNEKTPSFKQKRSERPSDSERFLEVAEQIEENMQRNDEDQWECKVCNRCFARKDHLKQHIETHLEGLSFDCPICGSTFRSRSLLAKHKHRNHRKLYAGQVVLRKL